ncbi:GntR family transcriptional regulator [Acuticoccus yangtzensis]|nr:GntR family transcriptional regulator [Acuticoccus yangtzensis]
MTRPSSFPPAPPGAPPVDADGGIHGLPAAQRVLAALRRMIIRGDLMPGSRIVERTLCAQLNVSRTPMREALKLLEIDGLIEISQHRGARVLAFTAAEALELFEVLASLEGLAAELAVARMTPSIADALSHLHGRMREYHSTRNRDAYFDCNSQIHEMIVNAAGNRALVATRHNLMLRAKRGRYMAIMSISRWDEAMGEHEMLMEALHKGDPEEAGRVWRRHLMRTGETVAAAIASAPSR